MADPARRARAAFGKRLRELRDSTGLTGAQFAERLGAGWDQPKVSRIERGKQLPTAAEIEAWASETGASLEDLMTMSNRAASEYATFRDLFAEAGGAARYQDAIGAAEQAATRIGQYQPALVLGLLQTADYARELLHLEGGPAAHGASEDEISHMIASRVRRAGVLHEPGRQIVLLLGEGALRTRFASPPVMAGQCEHIARLAESLTTAVIGIVPFSAQIPVLATTGWSIVGDVVEIETEGGDLPIADPLEVERYWRYTRLLLDVSLTGAHAAAFIREVARSLA